MEVLLQILHGSVICVFSFKNDFHYTAIIQQIINFHAIVMQWIENITWKTIVKLSHIH